MKRREKRVSSEEQRKQEEEEEEGKGKKRANISCCVVESVPVTDRRTSQLMEGCVQKIVYGKLLLEP